MLPSVVEKISSDASMDSTAVFFGVFFWIEDFKICGITLQLPPLGGVKGEILVYHSGYD